MPKRERVDLPSQPHDAIIKYTFSQREHAAGLLRAVLAPEISALVAWRTLKPEKIHFVDRGLRGRYADLLFSAKMGAERVYFHVLIEHQSKVEPLMIFRMGSYMWRQWEHLVRDQPARSTLPVIIPVLIHHSATGWTAATAFEDVLAIPDAARAALRPYVPHFRMKLVDVSRDPAGGLVPQVLTEVGRVVLFCLSVAGDPQRLETEIDQIVRELNVMSTTPSMVDALIAVVRYLVATQPRLDVAKIVKLLTRTARKGQKEVDMDVLDQLRDEGRKEGRAEGKRQGRAETLLDQLAARFGAVPAQVKARIRAAGAPSLARWSLRVLTAPTLDAVLDGNAPTGSAPKPAAKRRPAARKRAPAAR